MMNDYFIKLKTALYLIGSLYEMKDRDRKILFEAADNINGLSYLLRETDCETMYDLLIKVRKQEELILDLRKAKMLELKKRMAQGGQVRSNDG